MDQHTELPARARQHCLAACCQGYIVVDSKLGPKIWCIKQWLACYKAYIRWIATDHCQYEERLDAKYYWLKKDDTNSYLFVKVGVSVFLGTFISGFQGEGHQHNLVGVQESAHNQQESFAFWKFLHEMIRRDPTVLKSSNMQESRSTLKLLTINIATNKANNNRCTLLHYKSSPKNLRNMKVGKSWHINIKPLRCLQQQQIWFSGLDIQCVKPCGQRVGHWRTVTTGVWTVPLPATKAGMIFCMGSF